MTTLFGDEPKSNRKPKPAGRTEAIGFNPVKIWCETYKSVYMVNPLINKIDARVCCNAAEGADEATFRVMCQMFLACTDPRFVNEGHRVQDLDRCKNRWKSEASQR